LLIAELAKGLAQKSAETAELEEDLGRLEEELHLARQASQHLPTYSKIETGMAKPAGPSSSPISDNCNAMPISGTPADLFLSLLDTLASGGPCPSQDHLLDLKSLLLEGVDLFTPLDLAQQLVDTDDPALLVSCPLSYRPPCHDSIQLSRSRQHSFGASGSKGASIGPVDRALLFFM
jgi:hypothetical protein